VPQSGTLVFPPLTTTEQITVFVNGDTKLESDETFSVQLSNPQPANAGLGASSTCVITIKNDDFTPSMSIDDVTQPEGSGNGATVFTFTVTLSNESDQPISVDYKTTEGTAHEANNDFLPAQGTLTIPPKTDSGTIDIQVTAD